MKITTRQRASTEDNSLQAVYFEYMDPAAQSVAIAGTFNDWRPQVTPMVAMGGGRWRKVLVVAPGTYEYTFVVDGKWLEDLRVKTTTYGTESPPLRKGQLESVLPTQSSRRPRHSRADLGVKLPSC